MKQFSSIRELSSAIDTLRKKGKSIGFVPTMGALHEGHLSLIRKSKNENHLTVCSIFINPLQFNKKSDLDHYPRTLPQDIRMLEKEKCDVLFTPGVDEIYPDGKADPLEIDLGYLEKILEGKFRAGHFKGVAIVLKKLFDIVKPARAYFGKKDYQQLLVVRHLVSSLHLPIEVIGCELVREPDGLAMSSRNMRLTIGERKIAPLLFEVLSEVKMKARTVPSDELQQRAIQMISDNPAFKVEYLEFADRNTLLPLNNGNNIQNAIVLIAVCLGDVRLIDNMELF